MRNGNYGGFFQAFALQEKLQELGHTVSIDSPVVFKQNARSFVKYLFYLLSGRWNSLLTDKVRNAINQNFIDFASEKLNLTPSSQKGLSLPAREARYFDGFVVGSDQVWRPSYCNVEEYMFASLPAKKDDRPRISYGASFGLSTASEFNHKSIPISKKLLSRFSAISVRESSGVVICQKTFGAIARTVIDPTLFWDRNFYEKQCGLEQPLTENNTLLVISLDKNPQVERACLQLAEKVNAKVQFFLPDHPKNNKSFRSSPSKYLLQTPVNWISSIGESSCIVTDSYHGMLFAIIFRKPFITVGNQKRGQDRFESVLKLLELERQMVPNFEKLDESLLSDINWKLVEAKIESLINDSQDFLAQELN